MKQPDSIACALQDYIEIACLYGYRVELVLKNGNRLSGKAITVFTSPEKHEYLVIDNGSRQQIELLQLAKMRVLTKPAKFSEVVF